MTREEAIKMLKSKMDGHTDTSYEWAETVRMAIKALEQEITTENDLEVDCISRFEVTEIINEEWDTDIILDRIEALPSITPQEPKKGHWTHDGANVRCSNCGIGYKDAYGRTSAITYNFCPNCGADMRAESEDKS